jgi:hypothetical protein
MDRLGLAVLLGLSIAVPTWGPLSPAASAQPVDVPPAAYEPIGEIHCSPRAVAAGETLRCVASGVEGVDQIEISFEIWMPGTTTSEGYAYHYHLVTVPVGPEGTATVSLAVPDGEEYGPGDYWEVSAGGWGGPRQDCYAIDRATGDLLATGPYVPSEHPAVHGSDGTVLDPGDGRFGVGGQRFDYEAVDVRCADDVDVGAWDDGAMIPSRTTVDSDPSGEANPPPTRPEGSDAAETEPSSQPTQVEPPPEIDVDVDVDARDRAVAAGWPPIGFGLLALGSALALIVVSLGVVRLRASAHR